MTIKANLQKFWVSYLDVCERFIEQKQFQVPFVSYRIDKTSKCIYLTLASVISSELLKTIKQCRQGDNINLYTIKPPKKYKLISVVSHNLSFKEFYQQHYQGDSFFLLTNNIGAVIGHLPPKIIEQSELRTSERCLIELKQEIDFLDFEQVSAKFESLNSQTHTLKVSLSKEYLELTSVSGIITNSLVGDLHLIRVQKDAIKRLIEKRSCQPALDVFLFGQNKELKFPETLPLAPIPLYKHLNIHKLNEHQKLAIRMILASPDFFVLQGPPATGKSTVIVVLCSIIPLQGQKVLLSCQFNSAVDNIFSKLPKHQSILAVRLGEITKISEDVLEYFEKNAVITWLKSVAEDCDKNLQEMKKKFEQVDLFINCWEDVIGWVSWHQQSIQLLAIAENKKGIADKYQEAALEFKDRYLKTINIEKCIKLFIQEFQTHQFTYESNSELLQFLTEFKVYKVAPNLNQTESDLLEIATEIKQLILDIKPGGYIHNFKKDFAQLYRDIKLNILERQNSLKLTQEMEDKIKKIRFELNMLQNSVQNLKNILNHGITDESSEVVSLSSTYTSICERLSKFRNRNKSKITITIIIDAFQILRRQINFVQLIRSWEEAEINLLPNKINQHKYIYDKLINLEKLSTLIFVGRLYKPTLYHAKEQLKCSLENIFNNAQRHFYHAKTSDLAIKIHDEYNSELQIAEAKVIELTSQYEQEEINLQGEQRRYKKLLEDAQLCFGEANYLKTALNEVFEPFVDTIDLIEVENSLEIEELLKVNKNVVSMAASIEKFIPIAENKIIQPFQNGLLTVSEFNLSSQNEYALSEQSALDKANSFNEEYDSIMSQIKCKDEKHQLGHRLWEELRTQNSVPEFCNKPIPDLELLKLQREPWLSSIGGETEVKRLEIKIQIKEDWIAQIRSGDIEISDESYELFLKHANVVGATCIQAGNQKTFLNRFSEFDFTIIDEVSKATITEMVIPCLVGKKIVLAGDWKQLPPIFKDESYFIEAAKTLGVDAVELQKQLTKSLFKERYEYLEKIQASRTIMLINQYRMHSQIMSGVNPFYGNKLILGYSKQDSERAHKISIPKLINSKHHLMWVDLPLDNSNWHHQQIGTGRQNPLEAELIFSIIMKMNNSFKKDASHKKDIGIISVYKAQTDLIKSLYNQKKLDLPPNVTLTIGTVDEFQGMEKDIIFVSLVLNKPGVLPSEFLQTPERINVAISRAKSLLIITGSSHNYVELESEASPIYKHILDIAKNHNGHVRANKFMD
ncbi:hypothetical protein RIVM261_020260 [Rivularia sp. IAM M-261]|nr:hypothetical protein RIVM261_020260 [Rivularia sp. IAM M-261]